MPSLRIIYDVEGWAYHRRALALQKYAPPDFEVSIVPLASAEPPERESPQEFHNLPIDPALGETEPDLVFFLPGSRTAAARQALDRRGWRSKLVASWNSGWPRWINAFHDIYRSCDGMIINNAEYRTMTGRLPGTWLLENGVDLEVFTVSSSIGTRTPKVLWLGSKMARVRKRYDDLLRPLEADLTSAGITSDFRLIDSVNGSKLSTGEMAAWYNSGTILVCASRSEGTPNIALEAAACGCTVVSTPVGNMPELLRNGENGYFAKPTLGSFARSVRKASESYERLAMNMQEDIQTWSWEKKSVGFFEVFRKVLEGRPPKKGRHTVRPRPDYSKDLTVFVSTVGAPSYRVCLECLEHQDCTFQVKIIDHVAPLNAAFQSMLDECSTPFYLQVDEDMLLHPHAVHTLLENMKRSPGNVAILVGMLYDPHIDLCLRGIKIYRHGIVRSFPYSDVESCEKDQVSRLTEGGFRVVKEPPEDVFRRPEDALGLHGTHWTSASIYERYYTLERKLRRNPAYRDQFGDFASKFFTRFLDDPSELNYCAFMGALAGKHAPLNGNGREKDYRTYHDLPGYRVAQRLYRELTQEGPHEDRDHTGS